MTTDSQAAAILAFGAHPDDVEFGCGAVLAVERAVGRPVHIVIGSQGEAASNGTPAERTAEAEQAAAQLGATCRFLDLGGDCHLAATPATALALARVIREVRPAILLAPTTTRAQHPDHIALGTAVRDAARLARFGGLQDLKDLAPHAVDHVFHYAITAEAEPPLDGAIWVNVSDPALHATWRRAMEAHVTQARTRNYVELQLTRARLYGLRAGVEHAWPLWPAAALLFPRLPEAAAAQRF